MHFAQQQACRCEHKQPRSLFGLCCCSTLPHLDFLHQLLQGVASCCQVLSRTLLCTVLWPAPSKHCRRRAIYALNQPLRALHYVVVVSTPYTNKIVSQVESHAMAERRRGSEDA